MKRLVKLPQVLWHRLPFLRSRTKPSSPSRWNKWDGYRALFEGRPGFEIGGPTPLFAREGLLPLYPFLSRVDNCNFSPFTIWEGAVQEGWHFHSDDQNPPGYQYICEAVNLSRIASETYGVVLSSHTLEHIANPLQALQEWARILKPGGHLLLVLPDKKRTFDHRRPVTAFAHLLDDFERSVGEDDLTHLPEILALHDLRLDQPAGTPAQFKERSERNYQNRCLHQHVFDRNLVAHMLKHCGLQRVMLERIPPFHIVAIGRKGLITN